jgi:hypothetical protein
MDYEYNTYAETYSSPRNDVPWGLITFVVYVVASVSIWISFGVIKGKAKKEKNPIKQAKLIKTRDGLATAGLIVSSLPISVPSAAALIGMIGYGIYTIFNPNG